MAGTDGMKRNGSILGSLEEPKLPWAPTIDDYKDYANALEKYNEARRKLVPGLTNEVQAPTENQKTSNQLKTMNLRRKGVDVSAKPRLEWQREKEIKETAANRAKYISDEKVVGRSYQVILKNIPFANLILSKEPAVTPEETIIQMVAEEISVYADPRHTKSNVTVAPPYPKLEGDIMLEGADRNISLFTDYDVKPKGDTPSNGKEDKPLQKTNLAEESLEPLFAESFTPSFDIFQKLEVKGKLIAKENGRKLGFYANLQKNSEGNYSLKIETDSTHSADCFKASIHPIERYAEKNRIDFDVDISGPACTNQYRHLVHRPAAEVLE